MPARLFAVLLLCAVPWSIAGGHDLSGPTHNRIALSVDAGREVDNDLLVAVMSIHREGSRAARLADEVNRAINWALGMAGKVAEVQAQTLNYQTSPVYRDNALSGWRVSQSIRLQSKDSGAMSELIGGLQERLALQSIDFEISDPARRAANEALIKEALAEFRERAGMIAAELQRRSYRLIRVDVNTHGMTPRPMARGMAMQAEVAAPRFEAGTETLRVTVSGEIEVSEN